MENAEEQLGIKPENIVCMGDSAGATISAALALLCIERGYRVPDGLILAYPGNFISVPLIIYSIGSYKQELHTFHIICSWWPYCAFLIPNYVPKCLCKCL